MIYLLNIIFWKYGFLDYEPKWHEYFGGWNGLYILFFCLIVAIGKQFFVVLSFYINGLVKYMSEYIYRKRILKFKREDEHNTEMMTAFSYHTEKISDVIVFSCLAITALFQISCFITYSVYLSPSSFLIVAGLGFFLFLPIYFLERKSLKTNRQIFKLKDQMNNSFTEYLDKKENSYGDVKGYARGYMGHRINFEILNGIKRAYPEIVGIAFIIILLVFHKDNLLLNDKGRLITFFYFMLKISQTLAQFNFYYSYVRLNYEGYEKAKKFFEKRGEL